MTWPRLIRKLLAILCIIMLSGIRIAEAQTPGSMTAIYDIQTDIRKKQSTANYNGGVKAQTDGQCKLDDENKKKLADKAYHALFDTVKELAEFNKLILRNFKPENGSCHYLYNRWFDNALSDDKSRFGLEFTATAHAGASEVDKLSPRKLGAQQLMKDYVDKLDYAGIDVRQFIKQNLHADRNSARLAEWARTAPKGSVFEIDEATSKLLEDTFGYSVDCKYALMVDNGGSFQCIQGTSDVDAEKLQKLNQKWLEEGKDISAFSFQVAFSCTHDNCSNGKGPLQDQIDAMWDRVDACQADAEAAAVQRDKMIEKRAEAHNLLDVLSGNLEVHCICATEEVNGKEEKTEEIKECTAINPEFIEDNMDGCPTIEEYRERMTGVNGERCIICRLFQTILQAVQNIAQKAYDALAPALSGLVGVGFGIYIAYITLLAVAAPAVQKLSQYLTNLTVQGFKVAIALILLSSPHFVYGTLISPVLDGGIDFGMSLSRENEVTIKNYASNVEFNSQNTYLQANVLQNAVGAAVAFNESAALVPAIGRSLICNSWNYDAGFLQMVKELFGKRFWMRVQMWLEGIILYLFGIAIAFAVGFYMLDCALQLGIVCAMMPFFVACWPFKLTKGYTKQGWDIFLNTFFNFVVMGIIIGVSSELLQQALGTGLTEDSLQAALNSNDADIIMESIEFGGLQMVMLIICCLIALKISGEVQNITNKLSGGLNIGIGAGIGGVAGSTMTKAAAAVATSVAITGKASYERLKNSHTTSANGDTPPSPKNDENNSQQGETDTTDDANESNDETSGSKAEDE